MDLLIDAQSFQGVGKRRGIGRYSRELVAGVARVRPGWRVRVVMSDHLEELDAPEGVEVLRYTPPVPLMHCDSPTVDLLRLHFADWIRAQRPDAVLVLSAFEGGGIPLRFVGDAPPSLIVFYDLIPLLFPAEYYWGQTGHWRDYSRQLRQLMTFDAVLAISESSRADVRQFVPCRGEVLNIRGAVGTDFCPAVADTARGRVERLFERAGLPAAATRGFLLYVGGGDFRKNLEGLVEALALLPEATRDAHPLVIAGEMHAHFRTPLLRKAAAFGVSRHVLLTGFVSEQELVALYQACRLLVFPSLYEGLGLPVLEAVACGTDVASSDASSLPEFAGPGTVFFDAGRADDMAAGIFRALNRPERGDVAAKLAFAAGFTWDASAEAACRAAEAAVARPRPPAPPALVAWCREFTAAATAEGLAEFCAALGGPDAGRTVLVRLPGDGPTPAALSSRVRVFEPLELDRLEDAEPVGLHVYEADTPDRYAALAALLVRRPGVLILSLELARSEALDVPRHRSGLLVADRVLVRGLPPGEPLPPRFKYVPRAGPLEPGPAFAAALAEAAAAGGGLRPWRNAAVAALLQYPDAPSSLVSDWVKLRGGRLAPARTPAPGFNPKEGRFMANVPQKLLDLVGQSRKHLWVGCNPPFDFDSLGLYACSNFRATAEMHQQYDVVWCYEEPLNRLGPDQHLLALDELIRFVGAKGTLVLRFHMGQCGVAVKNFLGRRPGLTARITHEEEDAAAMLICVVEIERADIELYRPAPWTIGVLTQNTRKASVVALLKSVRDQDPAGEHEVIICGPEDPDYAFAAPRYLPQNYSPTLPEICRKKNDIARAATRPNLLIVHDRYRLDDRFFEGFARYGYDFDFLTVPQHFESGEEYPSYCHLSEESLRVTAPHAATNLNNLRLTPFINGGLMVVKTHLLRKLPLNELCFWNQAEDIELTVTMMRHCIAPRFNPYSSATTINVDKTIMWAFLQGKGFPAPEVASVPLAVAAGPPPAAPARRRPVARAALFGLLGLGVFVAAAWQVAVWYGDAR